MSGAIGIGQIGCGMIGQGHAYALRLLAEDGDIRPVAAADLSLEAVESAQRICPFDRIGTDAYAVINDPDVQAVAIVTPTTTHLDLVRATLEAGKPLLCEKPLATDFATVREMCELVAASGTTAQVGFHSRFHPVINELRALVESNELGRPMGYVLRDDQYWPTGDIVPGHSSWRSERAHAGGGALLEHSIHSADILSWTFGPAARVYARTRNVFGYDVEDAAACTVEHASGVVGTILTIFNGVRGREERRLEVFFEQGAVEVTTDFLVGAPEDSFLIQRPDAAAATPRHGRVARPLLRRGRHHSPRLHGLSVSRGAGVRRGRCGTAGPHHPASRTRCAPMRSSKRRIGPRRAVSRWS